jgi:hypothetical protein
MFISIGPTGYTVEKLPDGTVTFANAAAHYTVKRGENFPECTCPDFKYRCVNKDGKVIGTCKHGKAAMGLLA